MKKEIAAVLGLLLLVFVVCLGLAWAVQGNEFFLYRYFGPKQEGVRREVFEQTKSYRQGMIQELQNMQFDYVKADLEHKEALASLILHRAADFPEEDMPADLRTFIQELKRKRR